MSKITNEGLMMLYSCTHMATVAIKGLTCRFISCILQ